MISRVTTIEQFEWLTDEWDSLLEAAQIENIFLTHAWLREWWQIYGHGAGRQLWTLIARDEKGLAGIAPLMLERAGDGTRRLAFIGVGEIVPNHLDFIIPPEARADLTRAFCTYFWQAHSEWDVLELDALPDDSPTRQLVCGDWQTRGLPVQARLAARCPYVALPGSFETYLQSRGAETCGQLRAKQRRLARDAPEIRFARVETPDDLDRAFEALYRLHQTRWTRRGQRGSFSSPAFVAFHRAVAREALARGRLRFHYLQAGDAIVAAYYCFRTGRRIVYYNSGFDEGWGKYSVGSQILAHVLEQSILEGAREFDFLQDDEAYKFHWATHVRENWQVRAASPTLRGRAAWLRRRLVEALRAQARRMVPHPARRAIKRLWRRDPRVDSKCAKKR